MRLLWPIRDDAGAITQRFGENPNHPVFQYGPAGHTGVDIGSCAGLDVVASAGGTAYVADQGGQGYGRMVRIVHGDGWETIYAHLERWLINGGEYVETGQPIGIVGNTGWSFGSHLHWELRRSGAIMDPLPYVTEDWRMSKLGLFFQTIPGWAQSVVNESTLGWVQIIDPPVDNPFPQARTLGRIWIGGDHVEQELVNAGPDGAEEYFRRCLPWYESRPWVHVWGGPNEPRPFWDSMQALDRFSRRWADLMHSRGWRVGVGRFSVGQPPEGVIGALRTSLAVADYLILHEYARGAMDSYGVGWLCLRYRRTVAELRRAGIRVPPVIIGECGIDGGAVLPGDEHLLQPGRGWRSYVDRAEYERQLAWYDSELMRDGEIVAATPFVSGPNSDWVDFDVDEGLARWIASRYDVSPPEIPYLPEYTEAGVYDALGVVDKTAWWMEEMQRHYEAGDTGRANAIRLSLIRWLETRRERLRTGG